MYVALGVYPADDITDTTNRVYVLVSWSIQEKRAPAGSALLSPGC